MAWGKGYRTQLLLDWEDTYGSDPSSVSSYKLPFNTLDIAENQPNQHAATIRNDRNPAAPFLGNKDVTGTLVVPVEPKSIGIWLKAAFGAPTVTGSVSPYTHTYKIGNTILPFLLDVGHADLGLYYKYNGCKVNTFGMGFGGDGELICTMGIIGANETKGTSAYDATPVNHTNFALGRFYNNQASAKEGGSSIAYLTEVNFEVNNGLTPAYCIGDSGTKSDLSENLAMVTGTITGLFQDDTLLAKGRAQTESSLQIGVNDGTYSCIFYFNEVVYNHNKPPINGPEGILLSLNFEAYYYNHGDATALKAVLATSVSSYA